MRIGPTAVAPNFVFPLAVMVALSAPAHVTLWACLTLGMFTDLTNTVELANGSPHITVIGPYALGYMLAGQLILTMRGLMIRRNILTVAFLSMAGMVVCNIVVVAIFAIRGTYETGLVFEPTKQLIARLGRSVYTGLLALPLAMLLLPLAHPLGLAIAQQRRFARRTY